jgi:minor histocompatibility antigen H13
MVAQLLLQFQAGLFVYDIFWVFFTPVMVTVAKSFDAPIKVSVFSEWIHSFALDVLLHFIANSLIYSSVSLFPVQLLFPTADAARPFSMLGLGDIVIPG